MAPVWVWMRGAGLQVVGQTVGPNVRWDKLLVQMYGGTNCWSKCTVGQTVGPNVREEVYRCTGTPRSLQLARTGIEAFVS